MTEKEILIPATLIKENKDSYTVSIPGIGFNTEKKISKEGVVIEKVYPKHEYVNPCDCGCDGSEMFCAFRDEDFEECLKSKIDHEK